jgi:hypothetical protein
LLNLVVEYDDKIDFNEIAKENDRTAEENKRRWDILVKGLGNTFPGQTYKAT